LLYKVIMKNLSMKYYLSSRYAFEPGSSDLKIMKVTGSPLEARGDDGALVIFSGMFL